MPDRPNPSGSVFLSYASQDADVAARIGEALRAAGISVWVDKNELRGGDAWDAQIKRRIQQCALFVPLISRNSNARSEGYFRLEWNLAVRRLMSMSDDAPFLVPVAIDETREPDARVPDEFLRAQWTWLPGGETPPAFVERVRQLLAGEGAVPVARPTTHAIARRKRGSWAQAAVVAAGLAVLAGAGLWLYQRVRVPVPVTQPAAFAPPRHSVAVLAFLNLSGDPRDDYFSDGLSEELLNTLARVGKLQVAARTSSFSFKGTQADVPSIGRKLNVGAVLEGSIRRAGDRLRITAQLIDTVTGYHVWSDNFDREFGDVIALQSEIAIAVARALEVKLMAGSSDVQTPGGTSNSKALDAFLRGRAGERIQDETNLRAALVALDEAVTLDPEFANAHALRGDVLAQLAAGYGRDAGEVRRLNDEALRAVRRAVAIAPDSAFAYRELGAVLAVATSDYVATDAAYRRAMQLEPGSAEVLKDYGSFAVLMGRADALPASERARELDPLSHSVLANLGYVQYYARRHEQARKTMLEAMQGWDNTVTPGFIALNELALGNPSAALPYCERDKTNWSSQVCLAIAYHRLGRQPEAEAMLGRIQDESGDGAAYQYVQIFAQWNQLDKAMQWLVKAVELKDPGLIEIKADPLVDPLRENARFQEILARLSFPA